MKVKINRHAIEAKVQGAFKQSLPELSEIILQDCNEFCKWQEGALAQSAERMSKPAEGLLIWQTPYARRQYWEIQTAHTDANPNASWKWCEVAKSRYLDRWERQADALVKRNMK